jgi:hypothetical protein
MLYPKALNPVSDFFSTLSRLPGAHAGQKQYKVLAAVSKCIVVAGGFPKQFANRAKHRIAGIVPELVVEMLEVIDIEHDATDTFVVPARLRQPRFQNRLKLAPIGKAGQRVRHGHRAQLIAQSQITHRETDILTVYASLILFAGSGLWRNWW